MTIWGPRTPIAEFRNISNWRPDPGSNRRFAQYRPSSLVTDRCISCMFLLLCLVRSLPQCLLSHTQPGESGGNSSSNFLFPLLLSFLKSLLPTNSSLQLLTIANFPTNPNGKAFPLGTTSSSTLSIFVQFLAHRLPRLCPYTALRQTLKATFRISTTSPARALCKAARKSSFSVLPAREV